MNYSGEAARLQTKSLFRFWCAALCLFFAAHGAWAQSTEIDFPTPVRASEINGVILPRDVGDPRPTRHFYSLTGTPGDLVITVESKNLDGDVDLFTAGTLRPLAKISLYAGEAASSASKSIYLKRREALVLRIEARSPNEDRGGYRIRFEGGFEPIAGEVAAAPEANAPPASDRADQKTRRVTSVGARIAEPPAPVETSKSAEPAPTPQPSETVRTESTNAPARAESKTSEPASRPKPPNRNARTTRTTRTRPARVPRAARPAPEKTTTATVEPVQPEAEPRPAPAPSSAPATTTASPRLIIETRDGMRVERFMNTVRRVTVEGGQVVVITKDGKIERQPLTNILRMSIEP